MTDYNDDRPGMMRVHVAHQRAEAACKRYTRAWLNETAKAHGVPTGSRHKRTLAWQMAQHGYIAPDGSLRDGWPEVTS